MRKPCSQKLAEISDTFDKRLEKAIKRGQLSFRHANKPGTVTVAGKPGVDVPPGTLNSVLKQAGLKK